MSVSPIALSAGLVAPVLGMMDPNSNWLLYVVGGGGGAGILALLFNLIRDLMSGRLKARDQRDASLVEQRNTAWKERDDAEEAKRKAEARADCEAKNGRKLWAYATRLRRQIILLGVEPVAEEPDLDDCDLP